MNSGTGRKHFEAIPECSGFVNKRERRRAEWKKKAWRRKSMKRRKQEESTSIMKRMLLPATPRTSRRKIRHGGGALPADRIFSEERIRNVSLQQDHAADKTRGKRPGFCLSWEEPHSSTRIRTEVRHAPRYISVPMRVFSQPQTEQRKVYCMAKPEAGS